MFDIPNYVTLPLELGVAFLILLMDRRQRKRETDSQLRFLEQQKQARDAEIRQRERFNNWSRESSKRQIMLLESIMATLDADKLDNFKNEVGTRYAEELNQDMEDLDDLLEKKKSSDASDPELEADIESKIDEISSAKEFIKNFMPNEVISEIEDIAKSAKTAYAGLRDLPKNLEKKFPEGGKVHIKINDEDFEVDPENESEIANIKEKVLKEYKSDRMKLFTTLNKSIKDTIDEVTDSINQNLDTVDTGSETANQILKNVKQSLLGSKGLGKMIEKAKDLGEKAQKSIINDEEDDDVSDSKEEKDDEGAK